MSLLPRYGPDLDECWGDKSAEDCLRHIENPDAFPELLEAHITPRPTARRIKGGISSRQEIDRRRAPPQICGEGEGGPADPVARGPRARQKSSDAMIEPSFRLPDGVLWNVFRSGAAAPEDLLAGEHIRWTAARVRVYNARRPHGLPASGRGSHLQQRDDDAWTCRTGWNCLSTSGCPR